jgi:hypothetical protein
MGEKGERENRNYERAIGILRDIEQHKEKMRRDYLQKRKLKNAEVEIIDVDNDNAGDVQFTSEGEGDEEEDHDSPDAGTTTALIHNC